MEDLTLKHKFRASLSIACIALSACTTTPVSHGALSRYENLSEQKGILAKRRAFADPALLGAQNAVYIAPITFGSGLPELSSEERALVSNALARAVCNRIDDRISISDAPSENTLRVVITITELKRTNVAAAAAAVVALRAPIGLGALGVEAEAITSDGRQAASMIWRREADAVFTSARASSIGDAYNFASQFGDMFGGTLRRGIGDRRVAPASEDPCRRYGSTRLSASVLEMISPIRLPPSWQEQRVKKPVE
jgi:hypothetical protein